MHIVTLIIALVVPFLTGCAPKSDDIQKTGCVADIECKADRLCENGVCVEPEELDPSTNNATTDPQNSTSPDTNNGTTGTTETNSTTGTNATTNNDESTDGPYGSCLDIEPPELTFRTTAVDGARQSTLTVLNCGRDVEPLERVYTDDEIFRVVSGETADIQPGESHEITVEFAPEEAGTFSSTLRLQFDFQTAPIPLQGEASEAGTCPTAVAEAKLSDSSRWETELHTIPLKTIDFRGTNSVDPDGSVERYEWTLVERPTNSTAQFKPSGDVAEPNLFLDLAGNYVIELVVYDNDGNASCGEPELIEIRATPDEDIHVQLVWDTPSDQDQTDANGTDMDLHFLHPNGTWNNLPFDIFWNNPTNEWGAPGADDNPSLDIDDTDGAGPENINLTDPESGLTYAVGVYYYAANGFGPSYATVRIYIRGQQEFEWTEMYMPSRGSFWYVATISWPTTNIFEVNQVQQGFPNR